MQTKESSRAEWWQRDVPSCGCGAPLKWPGKGFHWPVQNLVDFTRASFTPSKRALDDDWLPTPMHTSPLAMLAPLGSAMPLPVPIYGGRSFVSQRQRSSKWIAIPPPEQTHL